jgi:hypothetical protein
MKKALFLAALCLLTLSASYADNGLPHQWNYGDVVYGHETQWNFDAVMSLIGSDPAALASVSARVATNEADILALQAADATHSADIITNAAAIASVTPLIGVGDTIKKLTIAYQVAGQAIPFTWSATGLSYFDLANEDVLRFRFDYVCYGPISNSKKWGTIDGCVAYGLASGTSFIPTATSLMTLEDHTAGASDWSVIASCANNQLFFIASFPVSVRAFGTCTITGK